MELKFGGDTHKNFLCPPKDKEIEAIKTFSQTEAQEKTSPMTGYQQIQYEELLKEMQRDTQAVSKIIIQTYIDVHLIKCNEIR